MKLLFFFLPSIWFVCAVEKLTYISVEHPWSTTLDPSLISYTNLTSKRYGRYNPVYYVGLDLGTLFPLDNSVTGSFYFYELLSNVYKRSFVEMHFKFCDLVHKDIFFGPALRQQPAFNRPCPFPPSDFHLRNMTIPPSSIPPSFPFQKGRIEFNMTYHKKVIATGHVDMEIKELKKKDQRITFSKI